MEKRLTSNYKQLKTTILSITRKEKNEKQRYPKQIHNSNWSNVCWKNNNGKITKKKTKHE